MSLQSRVSRRLAQLRVEGQLLRAPRPWPCPSAGATRTRSSACAPPASLGAQGPRARTPVGVGAWGTAAVRLTAGVRTWAPLAMAAKVDLSTSTDWKEAKSFLKGLSDKQREEHYFCRDFIRLKKIPTWKETAKGLSVKVEEPKYKKDKQLNEKISLFRGDITKLEVDAIINAASECSSSGSLSRAHRNTLVLASFDCTGLGVTAFAMFLQGLPSPCTCLGSCFLLCMMREKEYHRREDPEPAWNPREWLRMALDLGVPHRTHAPSRSSEQVFARLWSSSGLDTGQTSWVLGGLGTGIHTGGPQASFLGALGLHPWRPHCLSSARPTAHQGAAEIAVPAPSGASKSACLLAE
ncbi:ADP-ribose glycohydrolase MACROD1 isoform X1 [Rhinolophus sinicus]|uniref:ADP-ribose glycohydrolase MACROD1 isoform X1 n=1 Tax=Rhinolophus sinicus TaxID=89399 RepID=UPI003D7A05D8